MKCKINLDVCSWCGHLFENHDESGLCSKCPLDNDKVEKDDTQDSSSEAYQQRDKNNKEKV